MDLPKYDITSEQSLLWSILIDKDIIPDVLSKITSDYFYDDWSKYIFKSIAFLYSQSIDVDLITVKAQLDKFNILDSVWGITALMELTEIVPTSTNYASYMKIVIENYRYRQLKNLSYIINDNVSKNLDPLEIVSELEKWVREFMWIQSNDDIKQIWELLMNRYDELAEMIENPLDNKSVQTWYPALDQMMWGLKWGNLILLWWRPWSFKTWFWLNVANNNIQKGKRVIFFSLEMSEREIVDRFISIYTEVNSFMLRTWKVKEDDLDNIAEWIEWLHDKKLLVDASANMTPQLMKSRISRVTMTEPVDLIVVDYLWLMKEPSVKQNKTQEISEISRQLKLIAKEFNVPILALNQLSRAVETRADKHPIMSDLRDSWSLEQDADSVLMLYRDKYYDEFTTKPNSLEVWLVKNRHGATGNVELHVNLNKQLVSNMNSEWKAIPNWHNS